MRDNGVKDFPDPDPDRPLMDLDGPQMHKKYPNFDAVSQKCFKAYTDEQSGQ